MDGLITKGLLTGASNRANFRAFPLPISGPLPRTYSDCTLLCGDAGGFVNAFTAEGIYYAMVTGDHAARTAIDAIRANDTSSNQLRQYEQAWRKEIGQDLGKSVAIQRLLLADLGRVDRIVKAASRNPTLAALLARYATGAMPYQQFKRSLIFAGAAAICARESQSIFGSNITKPPIFPVLLEPREPQAHRIEQDDNEDPQKINDAETVSVSRGINVGCAAH